MIKGYKPEKAVGIDNMRARRRIKRNELLSDYRMLEKMSESLRQHQKNIRLINKRIAKRVDADFKGGLVENLDIVTEHMQKAERELEKAKKELKGI